MPIDGYCGECEVENDSDDKKTPQNRHQSAGIGVALGICFGAALGAALDNLGLGIALGIAIGAALGTTYGAQGDKNE